jgi:uncharacterized peroxidase-related enzyme
MPFFKSMPDDAGPGNVFSRYPEIYRHWAEMGQVLINGPSPLTPAERELIQAYVAGLWNCRYSYMGHTAAAHALGVEEGLTDRLLENLDTAPIADRLRPVFAFVRKLTLTPTEMTQADADAVFAAGWDEKALHDIIAMTARMTFMTRVVEGFGFIPMTPERARAQAEKRAKAGYVNLYPAFSEKK